MFSLVTMFFTFKSIYGIVPLVILSNESVLCYRYGFLGLYNIETGIYRKVKRIEKSKLRIILSYLPLTARFFGLNEIKAVAIKSGRFFLSYHRNFYIFDMNDSCLTNVPFGYGDSSSNVLYLTPSENGVVWGEYGYNPLKKTKSIYFYSDSTKEITCLYSFKEGEINHVHNIIKDKTTERYWIMTGDFDDSAAIYYTDDFFNNVVCFRKGENQTYRGCVGFSNNNTLYYATDSPSYPNYLVKIDDHSITKLFQLNGSCIYGYLNNGRLVFSSTVENEADEINNSKNTFRYNLGKGILNWNVYIYSFDILTESIKILQTSKKDFLPMLAFKYGCFRFPSSSDLCRNIVCFGQSVKKFDNRILVLKQ